MKLEQLFNSLIEKGWKPFGSNDVMYVEIGHSIHFLCRPIAIFTLDGYAKAVVSLRELLGKESGLRQFVCENKLIEMKYSDWAKNPCIVGEYPTLDCDIHYGWDDYHHWLMESALCDEDKLEQFLIENIKI